MLNGDYTLWHNEHASAPQMTVLQMRDLFAPGTKVLISVDGWGWTSEFGPALSSAEGRADFAGHIANMLEQTGADDVGMLSKYLFCSVLFSFVLFSNETRY
jgi:GH18 family chitinase